MLLQDMYHIAVLTPRLQTPPPQMGALQLWSHHMSVFCQNPARLLLHLLEYFVVGKFQASYVSRSFTSKTNTQAECMGRELSPLVPPPCAELRFLIILMHGQVIFLYLSINAITFL